MKWLLYAGGTLLALVGLAVVALLAIGGGRGIGQYETSVDVAKPAPVVFAWVTEPPRLKSWVGWLLDVQNLTPQTGGVGARSIWVMEDRNNNNQRMDLHTEVVRHEPDRLIETTVNVPEGFTGNVIYELQPLDANRTRLTYRATFHFHHWLAKLLEPVISRSARQKLVEDLERLKRQAEAE